MLVRIYHKTFWLNPFFLDNRNQSAPFKALLPPKDFPQRILPILFLISTFPSITSTIAYIAVSMFNRVFSNRVLLRVLSDRVPFRVLSDKVVFGVAFRVLSNRVLFRVLTDRSSLGSSVIRSSLESFLESSVIGSSSESSVIGSS